MTPLRVNADYELELFHNKSAPPVINQTIEFLAFFLEDAPLWSLKTYSAEYLQHIESITGRMPRSVKQGVFNNWWGPLKDIERERNWNSKLTSTQFMIDQGYCSQTHIFNSVHEMEALKQDTSYLIKDPYAMSGQKFQVLSASMGPDVKKEYLLKSLENGPIIVEPLLNRIYDFSHYIFPSGKIIAYQNLVDKRFQYKGSVFKNVLKPEKESLPFYSEISNKNWENFHLQFNDITRYYAQFSNEIGYSIDSFVYKENGELKIQSMSEINYRKTMGLVTWYLAQKFAKEQRWFGLFLIKLSQPRPLWNELRQIKEVIVLSPGDSRFEIILVASADEEQGMRVIQRINELLPDAQLSIEV